MTDHGETPAPILANKHHSEASAFQPGNLLREARRQKGLAAHNVPAICVLDPDGDLVRRLRRDGRAIPDRDWACYHSELDRLTEGGVEFGIVGCAVGASYAVLVAEQLFASGCTLLISMTSSGRLQPVRPPPYFILIDKALRDEGTSYCRHRNSPRPTTASSPRSTAPSTGCASRCCAAPPGRPTLPSARRSAPSRR